MKSKSPMLDKAMASMKRDGLLPRKRIYGGGRMSLETAMDMIDHAGLVFNLGQLSPETLRQLNRLTRKGELARIKTMWPWQHYGMARKTAYCKPEAAAFYS